MNSNTTNTIGLSALEADKKFNEVHVWSYRFTVTPWKDGEEPTKRCRRMARMISASNGWMPATELDAYTLITIKLVEQLEYEFKGEKLTLVNSEPLILTSCNNQQREAIERLINQDIQQAARQLAKRRKGIEADQEYGNTIISEIEPSTRIAIKSDYLSVFQTLQIVPKLLVCGTLLIELNIKHRILANPHITLEWVIQKRPEWLKKIDQVRHIYSEFNKGFTVAKFDGIDQSASPETKLVGLEKTILEYHQEKALASKDQLANAAYSSVIRVRYAKRNESVMHLAALVQPMFDFDTLQQIDSPLLNRLAKHLKWPMHDRIYKANELVKGLSLAVFATKFNRLNFDNYERLSVKPDIQLRFHKGTAANELAVLRLKAFSNMTRQKVTPLIVGKHSDAEQDVIFSKIKKAYETCQSFCSENLPPLTKLPEPIISADELDQRLNKAGNRFENAILLIALANRDPKKQIRDVAFSHKIATQFMRYDHRPNHYNESYYHNLAAGIFSKGGGQLCAIENMPGDSDLFIGLDMGGTTTRSPGFAFLFTRKGAQLGWQLADRQKGERMHDEGLELLLSKSLTLYKKKHNGCIPKRITLHRDGKFYESLDIIKAFSEQYQVEVDVLEVLKSGAPVLYRRHQPVPLETRPTFSNPDVGDAVFFPCQDEIVVSTYSGDELGKNWGNAVSVRPLRLRKRYGSTDLITLAKQVVLLSRIHGASLYRHPRLPVTTHHADRFATLRQEVDIDSLGQMDRMCPVYL
jgi:hypothetical protein